MLARSASLDTRPTDILGFFSCRTHLDHQVFKILDPLESLGILDTRQSLIIWVLMIRILVIKVNSALGLCVIYPTSSVFWRCCEAKA
jgi:hypothetical protein